MSIHGIGRGRPILPPDSRSSSLPSKLNESDSIHISGAARDAQRIATLARQVLALPECRPELLEQVRSELQTGELLTPDTARQTARSILAALRDGNVEKLSPSG